MARVSTLLAYLFLGVVALPTLADAQGVGQSSGVGVALSSGELINQSFVHDNTVVLYRGEVVGPVMFRGEDAWVNVYDGTYAIGLFCPADDARKIKFWGDYNKKGDTIEVTGVFHRTCTAHGGDLDIHCSSLTVVEEGKAVTHPIGVIELLTVFLLGLIVIVLFYDKIKEEYRVTKAVISSPTWRIFFRIRRNIIPGVVAEIAFTILLIILAAVVCVLVALIMGWVP
ncbi:MAG: hypothetical protein V1744_06600 [Candidatus Altiarchaeota archaeon]